MIGVFDSGFGGLTVLRAFLDKLPAYDYIYLGDNARTPYGNKADKVMYNYTRQAAEYLFARGCVLIILACNTASAQALRRIQQEYLPAQAGLPARFPDRRVLGVLIPVAEAAVEASRNGRIGVIGTRATVGSGAYARELKKIRPNLEIYQAACPLLVPLVEEGWVGKPEANMILKKYLRPLKEKKIDTLIPGCTHYSFFQEDLERIMGKNCRVLDAPASVADKLTDYLHRHPEIESRLTKKIPPAPAGRREFYTTDDPVKFKSLGQKYLGQNIEKAEKIELA